MEFKKKFKDRIVTYIFIHSGWRYELIMIAKISVELQSHMGVIELVETNKKAHVYIWPIVKIYWLLK